MSAPEKSRLDSLTDSLYTNDRIELHGHCDSIGTDTYNNQLSQKRVQAVLNYLLNNGWDKKDIVITTGHGENIPVHNNSTPEERRLNRRVEIKIIPAFRGVNNLVAKISSPELKVGSKFILNNLYFRPTSHVLENSSQPALQELLILMHKFPALVIQIEGHVCCQAGPEDGYDKETGTENLSETRAKAIYDFLITNSIAPERLSYIGLGHSAPIYPYPEKSAEESLANRRVEIRIMAK